MRGTAVKTSSHLATTEYSLIRPSIAIAERFIASSAIAELPDKHCSASVFA